MSVMIKADTVHAIRTHYIFSYGVPYAIVLEPVWDGDYCLLLTADIHNRYLQVSLSARPSRQLHKRFSLSQSSEAATFETAVLR
jgi:hypothetical protein